MNIKFHLNDHWTYNLSVRKKTSNNINKLSISRASNKMEYKLSNFFILTVTKIIYHVEKLYSNHEKKEKCWVTTQSNEN